MIRFTIILTFALLSIASSAQQYVTTFGLEVKPIIPSNLFRAGIVESSQNGIDYAVDQQVGYSFGGVMRFGLTRWLSLESGISYTRRNFMATVSNDELEFQDTTSFRIIGYEIPLTALVFVRLSEQIYMNTAFGLALDMFPSDVGSGDQQEFYQVSRRRGFGNDGSYLTWSKLGLIANIGFEYRTESSGYFYIGGSYHRPFQPIYDSYLTHQYSGLFDQAVLQLSGNYLTIDFRYFFHEDPEKKKKKEKRDPDTMPSWMQKRKN